MERVGRRVGSVTESFQDIVGESYERKTLMQNESKPRTQNEKTLMTTGRAGEGNVGVGLNANVEREMCVCIGVCVRTSGGGEG